MSAADFVLTIEAYRKAKEEFEEFKKLRETLRKPLRKFIDPERTRRDLEGEEFYTLLGEGLGKAKPDETRRLEQN